MTQLKTLHSKNIKIIMAQDNNNLIWVDMEMTGLNPDTDRIIEVALVVTDSQLNTIAEGPVLVVHQPNEILDGMDKWNKSTHSKSGLIDKIKASRFNEAEVEAQMIEFLKLHVPSGVSPMCGNSICQDRRFMVRSMPHLETYFHYRNLDVSTLKELVKRWKPEIVSGLTKESKHEALADIYDSINELKYYRQHFIVA
ncbi:oligoribonuclease [Nitrosomonas sp. Nm84]|nr:oligoribonuclease [Nitrosomonas sp. Nm84]